MIERCVFIQTGNREGCVGHTETWKVKEDRMKGRLESCLSMSAEKKENRLLTLLAVVSFLALIAGFLRALSHLARCFGSWHVSPP